MTPKVEIFENIFPDSATGHWTTFLDQIWWKSAVAKLPKGSLDYHTKIRSPRDWSQPTFYPKWGRSRPKFLERCHPLTCPRIPNLVRIGCSALCRTYSGKIDFSSPKVIAIIKSFQPTIKLSITNTKDRKQYLNGCHRARLLQKKCFYAAVLCKKEQWLLVEQGTSVFKTLQILQRLSYIEFIFPCAFRRLYHIALLLCLQYNTIQFINMC